MQPVPRLIEINALLQWLGFAGVVASAYFFTSRPKFAAACCAVGCVFLGWWCLATAPIPWGVFAVQATVGVLSARNIWLLRDRRDQS